VALTLAGLAGGALLIALLFAVPMRGVQTEADVIPTARVMEGDVPVVVHTTGEQIGRASCRERV